MHDDRKINLVLDLEIHMNFEENSPYQEGIITEIYQRPDKSQLIQLTELADLVNTNIVVQKYLPRQTDIEKNLENYSKKSFERHSSPCNNKGDTSRISKQPIV